MAARPLSVYRVCLVIFFSIFHSQNVIFEDKKFLQIIFFSFYQTQNLGFIFSKYVFWLPNAIPTGPII